MSRLLQLANETLFQIIDNVTPDDITNFVLCSKDFYRLGQDALQLHRAWKKAFSGVVFKGCGDHDEDAHPITVLAEICKDWRVAYYVRSMTIDCGEIEHEYWQAETDLGTDLTKKDDRASAFDRLFQQYGSDIQSLMAGSPCFSGGNGIDCAPQYYWERDRESVLGLLLISLPNVRSVSFSEYLLRAKTIRRVIGRLAALQAFANISPGMLSYLTELRIYGSSDFRHEGEELCLFASWMALPSLRSLYGHSIESYNEFDWHIESKTSHVTKIDFQRCSISPGDIRLLLSGMLCLKEFSYDYEQRMDFYNGDHLLDVLMALQKHNAKTLEYLALTTKEWTWCVGGTSMGGIILEEFELLKEARLPCNAFLKDRDGYEGANDEADLRDWLDDIPRLVDLLPASIEKIELDGEITMVSVENLLIGLDANNPNYKRQKSAQS